MVLLRKNVEERIESLRADPIGSPTTLPKLSTHAVLPITIQRNEGSELDIEVNPDFVVQIKKHWYYPLTALEILSPLLSLVFLPIFLNVIKISPQPSISSTVPGLSYFAWSTSESYVELQKTTFDLEDYHPTNVDIGLYALCLALSFITGFLHYKSRQSPMLKNVLIRILIKLFIIIVYTAMLKIPAYSKIVVLTTLAAVTAASVPILMYILKKLVFSKYAIGKTKHVSVKDLVDNYIHTQVLKAMKAGQEQYAYSIDRPSHPTFRVYENILESIDKSFEVWQARKRMLKLYKKGKIYYMVFAAFLVFLAVSNFLVEFLKILNSQGELLEQSVGTMNSIRDQNSTISPETLARLKMNSIRSNKVLVILLDGLRQDYFDNHPDMAAVFKTGPLVKDMKKWTMTCQLPSMSLPNWLTIMAGAPPEVTGLLNNIAAPETTYDNIFRRARQNNDTAGITGSPTFAGLVASSLPKLKGDGSVAISYNSNATSAEGADQERYVQALAAIKATESPYRLFLAHFSDIDIQGHNFGVAPQFNKDNTYYKAITHKAKLVNELLNAADENTTVIVLADHGQVDAGGHGGTSPFNMEVPLVFYRKNSNFSNPALTGPPLLWQQLAGKYSNMDVAGTIDMLLGYPIPAMTQGYIVPEAFSLVNDGNRSEYERLVMKDLFKQKQVYVSALLKKLGMSFAIGNMTLRRNTDLDPPDYPSHQYLAESIELIKAYSQARSDWNSRFIIRNVVLVIFFNIITILTFIFLMEYFTFASPFCFVSLFNFNHSKHEYSAEVHKSLLKNRRAMILSFFAVLLQFALINIIFYAYYGTKGYGQVGTVDSTILHTPQVLPAYLVTVILTSWVTQYVVEKLFVLVHVDWSVIRTVGRSEYDLEAIDTNESSRGISLSQRGRRKVGAIHYWAKVLFGATVYYKDIQMVYLLKEYLLLWSVVAVCICLSLMSYFAFIIPFAFDNPFIEMASWGLRFRILTLCGMTIPILLGHFKSIISWPSPVVMHQEYSILDPLFYMGALKFYHMNYVHMKTGSQPASPNTSRHNNGETSLTQNHGMTMTDIQLIDIHNQKPQTSQKPLIATQSLPGTAQPSNSDSIYPQTPSSISIRNRGNPNTLQITVPSKNSNGSENHTSRNQATQWKIEYTHLLQIFTPDNVHKYGSVQDLADIALRKQYYGLPDDEGKKE